MVASKENWGKRSQRLGKRLREVEVGGHKAPRRAHHILAIALCTHLLQDGLWTSNACQLEKAGVVIHSWSEMRRQLVNGSPAPAACNLSPVPWTFVLV